LVVSEDEFKVHTRLLELYIFPIIYPALSRLTQLQGNIWELSFREARFIVGDYNCELAFQSISFSHCSVVVEGYCDIKLIFAYFLRIIRI